MDQAVTVRKGEKLDEARVEEFIHNTIPGLNGTFDIKQFPSGHSNLTYLITVGNREMVLRRPPFGKKAKTAHDMGREYRVLSALNPVYPYCPRPLTYTEDSEIMGCPFYVMERIKGLILRKEIPEGMNISPENMTRLCENLLKVLNELHTIDYQAIGLGEFGKPEGYVKRQVTGWSKRYRAARTPDVPAAETLMTWLSEKMPRDTDRPCIIHNDFKFDNVVLDPKDPLRIIGVLDWEMTTIGDPLMDLGGSLAYWVEAGDPEELQRIRMLPTNYNGALTRKQIADFYSQLSGRSIGDYDFYYCFGLFKLSVIAQQIYYRYYHGQTKDERFKMFGFFVSALFETAIKVIDQSRL